MDKKFIFGGVAAIIILGIVLAFSFSGEDTSSNTTQNETPAENNPPIQEENRELGDVFFKYRLAIDSKNLERVKTYVSSDFQSNFEKEIGMPLTQEVFSQQVAPILISALPKTLNVKIIDYDINDNTASWDVMDSSNPDNTGTIEFVKENNVWKVKKETWKESLNN